MMTIEEVLFELGKASPTAYCHFDFCGAVPTEVASWRGIYAEPALGWASAGRSGNGQSIIVSELIDRIKTAIDGRTFNGWKGGHYSYTAKDTLHVDNPGEWTSTELHRVEIEDEYRVTLHTKREA